LCHVSSIAAIGRGGAEDLITEKTSWKTSRYNSHYAVSKYGAEREVWRGIEEGLSAVIVNPAIILGYGETDSGTARIFHSVWKGLHIYPGGINGFVDVLDVVKAMILLMKNGISGERYILSVDNISYKQLFSDIAAALGKRKPGIRANAALAGIAWRVEAVRAGLFGSKPLLTRETAVTSMQEYIYSGKKILDVDAFSYTPFEDTIQRLSGYYKEEWGS
jgi:nucleoside-diphosphate-sugar epimerase